MMKSLKYGLNEQVRNTLTKRYQITTIILFVLLLIYIGFSSYVARKLKGGLIPDEGVHTNLSIFYSSTWGIPEDTSETYQYGYMGHKPFLYYWINGRLNNLLKVFYPSLSYYKFQIVLRLINVVYGVLTVFFGYLLAKEVIVNQWWRLLVVFMLTNTLMFVFLSGGVNYDNLTNLCSFAGIYFLARVFNGKSFYINSLGWMVCIATGTLVKLTVLPLVPIMGFTWILYIIKYRRQIDFRPALKFKTVGLFIILIGLIFLNYTIYGINLIKYHTVSPRCEVVLTEEQCQLNPVVRRDTRIRLAEELTFLDIIHGKGPDPIEWFLDFWIPRILGMVFGVAGHSLYIPDLIITFYRVLLIWIILLVSRYWKQPSFTVGSLISILFFYILVLLRTNYDAELVTNFTHVGIQGRYIFPVIGIIYTLIVYSYATIPHKLLSLATSICTIMLFLWSGPIIAPLNQIPAVFPKTDILPDQPIGEIVGKMEVSQDFTSQCKGTIVEFELLISTYDRTNTHPVVFRLTNLTNDQLLSEQTIEGEILLDNAWRSFPIAPLSNSKDITYQLTVTSPESTLGNAITLWTSNSDAFPEGQALLNGEPTGNDLSFRYWCIQPVFSDWFN